MIKDIYSALSTFKGRSLFGNLRFCIFMEYTDFEKNEQISDVLKENNEFNPRFNLIGKKIGRLYVKSFAYKKGRKYYYNCICDCGKECVKHSHYLLDKSKYPHKSCGCWHREINIARSTKHGMTKSDTYKTWCELKQRCCNPKNHAYECYGGRGIKICDRWFNSFENFLEDMGERPSKEYSIDRINVNGNYEPSNCRWATDKEQCNNRRSNVIIQYKGRTQNLKQWCDELCLNYGCVNSMRVRSKRSFDEIVQYYKNKSYGK